MCSHYQAVRDAERLRRHFWLDTLPPEGGKFDVWPGYLVPFIRRHEFADVGDEAVAESEPMLGSFGLIPHWVTEEQEADNRIKHVVPTDVARGYLVELNRCVVVAGK